METQDIWNNFSDELYFFILEKVKDKNVANDICQNTFLKIHKNLSSLREDQKVKAWVFQIARNEMSNYFNAASVYADKLDTVQLKSLEGIPFVCCFDQFIDELPDKYREVVERVYLKGQKQKDVAAALGISLDNTKARVRRAKEMLKEKFSDCCKYEFDKQGKLIGEGDCARC